MRDETLCPGTAFVGATLRWELRGLPNAAGEIPMFRNLGKFEATIPPQPEGEVLRWAVELELEGVRFRIRL